MIALGGLIAGMMVGIVARELWTRWCFNRKSMQTICRELAEATSDPVERAALLEIAAKCRRR
ncbi:hypothetical protein [Bradyrhizobium sp. CCBAU 11361]|uniref:hypothetical protein n=1 Tax=Bradyrhizobium sp. CCBAU 11361 TaxID=1630812 RepID=UPI002303AC3C|nr:hypothetical protein [Bradyrhizobium sp. CCBAU 11361]MDA9490822.1 hypothetical protein [Bradyrhizobium sp. CCBAU 11361]